IILSWSSCAVKVTGRGYRVPLTTVSWAIPFCTNAKAAKQIKNPFMDFRFNIEVVCLSFIPAIYSVPKGDAGSPSLLNRFGSTGLSAQAYRTYFGSLTVSFQTMTLSPSIFALAQTNFLSDPAMANSCGSSPSLVIKPPPVWENEIVILSPEIDDDW